MRRLWVSRPLLFIIFAFWTTASVAAISLGAGLSGGAQFSAGQGFPPKLQYGIGASFDAIVPLNAWLDMTASLVLDGMFPSDAQGGFTYRGFGGSALSLMLNGYATVAASPRLGMLRLGAGLGGTAALPAYQYTALYFFYLEAEIQAIVEYRPAALPRVSFTMAVPLEAQLRRDMDYSVSTGLSFGVAWKLGK
jgi:hypothetical protein